jgi:putative transposase
MLGQEGYPVAQACRVLGLPRSSYYYRAEKPDEEQVVDAVKEVVGKYVTYGTRRVTQQLHRPPYQWQVNRKRIQRIMRHEELLRPVKTARRRTTNSQHPYPRYPNLVKELEITHPDQVWVADITYIRLQREFVYLAMVMDVYPRIVRGWCLSRLLDQELTLSALQMALQAHRPEIHHSDQGIQYAAQAYTDLLKEQSTQISMAAVGKAEENGFAERFMRTLKEEEVDLTEYRDFPDARSQIGHFIETIYNRKRIHSALGYLTPVEFELAWELIRTQPAQLAPLIQP